MYKIQGKACQPSKTQPILRELGAPGQVFSLQNMRGWSTRWREQLSIDKFVRRYGIVFFLISIIYTNYHKKCWYIIKCLFIISWVCFYFWIYSSLGWYLTVFFLFPFAVNQSLLNVSFQASIFYSLCFLYFLSNALYRYFFRSWGILKWSIFSFLSLLSYSYSTPS